MIHLDLDSLYLRIGGASTTELKLVDSVTSYTIDGAWFSKAYKKRNVDGSRAWDGKQHLLSYSNSTGYKVHSGCAGDVCQALRANGLKFEYVDRRPVPPQSCDHQWTGLILTEDGVRDFEARPYQVEAAEAVLSTSFPLGRCMVKLPIRSGKTVVAAMILGALNIPSIFVTTSELLLDQTVKLYQVMFGSKVGVVGGGMWDPADLTVATIQTLHAHMGQPEYKLLMERADCVIFDEVHHFTGQTRPPKKSNTQEKRKPQTPEEKKAAAERKKKVKSDSERSHWKDIILKCPANWKLGLSATIYVDITKANEKPGIWLKAATGNICYEVTTKKMIEGGYLLRPAVEMYRVVGPNIVGDWAEDEIYRRGIVNYVNRNKLLQGLAKAEADDGGLLMVHAHHHEHIDKLYELLTSVGILTAKLSGKTTKKQRHDALDALQGHRIQAVVGNIFGEGLDVPKVDVVIVAEAGDSRKKTLQRLRNLTPSRGKRYVKVIDFMDEHEPHLLKQSRSRLRAYKAEDAFDVRVIG